MISYRLRAQAEPHEQLDVVAPARINAIGGLAEELEGLRVADELDAVLGVLDRVHQVVQVLRDQPPVCLLAGAWLLAARVLGGLLGGGDELRHLLLLVVVAPLLNIRLLSMLRAIDDRRHHA